MTGFSWSATSRSRVTSSSRSSATAAAKSCTSSSATARSSGGTRKWSRRRRRRAPAGPGVRVDGGVGEGTAIGVNFDPMLAKLICNAPTRDACTDRLERALRDYIVLGTKTNVSWLRRVIAHPAFRAGLVSTRFLGDHEADLRQNVSETANAIAAALVATARNGAQRVTGATPALPSV